MSMKVRVYKWVDINGESLMVAYEKSDGQVDEFGELILPQEPSTLLPKAELRRSGEWSLASSTQLSELLTSIEAGIERDLDTASSLPVVHKAMKMVEQSENNTPIFSTNYSTDEHQIPAFLQQPSPESIKK